MSTNKPTFTEIDRMGGSRSNRHGAKIVNFLFHTEEGNASAEGLAAFCNNQNNGASYHYIVRDSIVCDVVDTDYASWSVLDANAFTINLCFAGSRAGWSREQWLERKKDIEIAVCLAVQDCKKYKFSTKVIGADYSKRQSGISDHRYVTKALGIGNHTDCGNGFPWDLVEKYVVKYTSESPVNRLDEVIKATPWLGTRITEGETTCADGQGRWAQFENGYVYWSPATGARAIPDRVFETYAEHKQEAGLGYPVTDSKELRDGWVQGFERGAIYRKNGQPGFAVTGDIRKEWNASGFEDGTYGWPRSNEISTNSGVRYQEFEKGRLVWSPTRVVGLIPADGPDIIN